MPTKQYALDPDGPKRLEVSWGLGLKNFTVGLDGAPVGVATPEELKAGKHITLPDGSDLFACFRQTFGNPGLELTRNGRPLAGSNTDPATQVKTASQVLYIIGALNALVSAASLFSNNELLQRYGGGIGGVIEGLVYLTLGFFTAKRSQVALLVGTALYILESGYIVATTPISAGIALRVLFAVMLVRGVKAVRELKTSTTPATAP